MGDDVLNNGPSWRSLGSSLNRQCDLRLGSRLGMDETKPFAANVPPGFALNDSVSLSQQKFYDYHQTSQREYGFNGVSQMPIEYAKDFWVCDRGQTERFFNVLSSGNAGHGVMPELALEDRNMQMGQLRPLKSESQELMDDPVPVIPEIHFVTEKCQDDVKLKLVKMRKSRKELHLSMGNGGLTKQIRKQPTKRVDVTINGIIMDISRIPTPVCSCTGSPQQCYRWGSDGWQSACCTMLLSEYPLPMRTDRHGVRIAGRKMSVGAFKKVIEKRASEGYDFSVAIDLKAHWARHGTNKYIILR